MQEVHSVYDTDEGYNQTLNRSQLDEKTLKELKKSYPEDYFEENVFIIPDEIQLNVAIESFNSTPYQPEMAQMTTDTFTSVFIQSGLFKIVGEEQFSNKVVNNNQDDSKVMSSGKALDLRTGVEPDCVVRGSLNQAGGNTLFAEVLDTDSGHILISRKISFKKYNRKHAETLARMVISSMALKYYENLGDG